MDSPIAPTSTINVFYVALPSGPIQIFQIIHNPVWFISHDTVWLDYHSLHRNVVSHDIFAVSQRSAAIPVSPIVFISHPMSCLPPGNTHFFKRNLFYISGRS